MDPWLERWMVEQAAAFERWAVEHEAIQRPILEELGRQSEAAWASIAADLELNGAPTP